jgi:hypothetical protein
MPVDTLDYEFFSRIAKGGIVIIVQVLPILHKSQRRYRGYQESFVKPGGAS